MAGSSWKEVMEGLIKGAESEFRSSTPAKTRMALNEFRLRLRARRVAGGQKKFEKELEAFLQRDPLLRAATERHLVKQIKLTCDRMVTVLKKVEPALADFRKKRQK
jgi:hypothetical protein